MARIAGVDLPREKRIEAGLTYIYTVSVLRRRVKYCKKPELIPTSESKI